MSDYIIKADLAGDVCFKPSFLQTKTRIYHSLDRYLTPAILCDRLEGLPEQFFNAQPRCWQPINWTDIDFEQVLAIDLDTFLDIIKGALEIEASIKEYTHTSRQHLQLIHPAMARFVNGVIAEEDSFLELGLWEKQERQHTSALVRMYWQLTRQKTIPDLCIPKAYRSCNNAEMDLYRHGIHRIATEYSAVCLYLWLMARTTGSIQQVFQELLLDNISHLAKFWGFGKWLYLDRDYLGLKKKTNNHSSQHDSLKAIANITAIVKQIMKVLQWESWNDTYKIELIYTFTAVWQQMWTWNNSLTSEYLTVLFASSLLNDL